MIVKLTQLLHTRFIYCSMNIDLNYMNNMITAIKDGSESNPHALSPEMEEMFKALLSGESVTIDIAGAKFTPDTTSIIPKLRSNNIKVIDSEDKGRNDILLYNDAALHNSELSKEELPALDSDMKTSDYIKALRTDIIYKLPVDNITMYTALACMINIVRPKVSIALDSYEKDLIKYLSQFFTIDDLCKYDSFIIANDSGVMLINSANGNIYLPGKKVPISEVSEHGYVIPAVFGTKKLYNEEPWNQIFKECEKKVNTWKRNQVHTFDEYIH